MTTIAYRDGVMAADSRVTYDSEAGGTRMHKCEKLFRKQTKDGGEAIIGLAGETAPGLLFLDWYGSGKKPLMRLIDGDADFTALVLRRDGLFVYDAWCRGEKVLDEFFAIGSGSKAALGAMYKGAGALEAVDIASRIDPYTSAPFTCLSL